MSEVINDAVATVAYSHKMLSEIPFGDPMRINEATQSAVEAQHGAVCLSAGKPLMSYGTQCAAPCLQYRW